MPNYRRTTFPGGYYFFTMVTYRRKPVLITPEARDCLRHAWEVVRSRHPFRVIALCLLPNHLHCIWKLPAGDANFSLRWSMIKGLFSREYRRCLSTPFPNNSRNRKREIAFWQRRFWEHQLRDESDLQRHFNYTHYNPVKHGLVKTVDEWPFSTYHQYKKKGWYPQNVVWDMESLNDPLFMAVE
jgi:putative transposase